jgi:uncharacterized protein YbaR (Trm112 family)
MNNPQTENTINQTKCPRCKNKLETINNIMICGKCKTTYTINQGLPVMTIDTIEKAS